MSTAKHESKPVQPASRRKSRARELRAADAGIERAAIAERITEVVGPRNVASLAAVLGVSPSTIYDWKSGRFLPDIERLSFFASLTGTSLQWLIDGSGSRKGAPLGYVPLRTPLWIDKPGGERIGRLAPSDFAVSEEWIGRLVGAPKPGMLVLLQATGDAMAPTIRDKDLMLINSADKERRDGIICAIEAGELKAQLGDSNKNELREAPLPLLIRRLAQQLDGSFHLICDNPSFPPTKADEQPVFGRVIWLARNL